MKSLFAVMLFAATTFAGILPEGKYTGLGDYEMEKGTGGTYHSTTTVGADGSLTFEFRWADQVKTIKMQLAGTAQAFDILEGKKKVGSGQCDGPRCDYSANPKENLEIRETLVFTNDKLLRFGTKKENGKLFTWYQRELK